MESCHERSMPSKVLMIVQHKSEKYTDSLYLQTGKYDLITNNRRMVGVYSTG